MPSAASRRAIFASSAKSAANVGTSSGQVSMCGSISKSLAAP